MSQETHHGPLVSGLLGVFQPFTAVFTSRSAPDASASEALRYDGYKWCSIFSHSQTKHTSKVWQRYCLISDNSSPPLMRYYSSSSRSHDRCRCGLQLGKLRVLPYCHVQRGLEGDPIRFQEQVRPVIDQAQ